MENLTKIKPDYVKCLNDNPTWTTDVITGIAGTLNTLYSKEKKLPIITVDNPEPTRALIKLLRDFCRSDWRKE